ncbi:hypothetical protein ACTXT7_006758 [Hymenolepis weldensis]
MSSWSLPGEKLEFCRPLYEPDLTIAFGHFGHWVYTGTHQTRNLWLCRRILYLMTLEGICRAAYQYR